MCGIVGYIGNKNACKILLEGLSRLEYRGYDSAGIALKEKEKFNIIKAKGKLENLIKKIGNIDEIKSNCGIGHTRWATHGKPSENNAHPHNSQDGNIVVVHNGIIENYLEIKTNLIKKRYKFYSQTDTEVIAKLLDYYLKESNNDILEAINKFMLRVTGSYALAIMIKSRESEIYVAKKDSPLIIGVNKDETFIASDVPAILKHTRNVYYLENNEMAKIIAGKVIFYNSYKTQIQKELCHISMSLSSAEKNGYEHFMLKEIHEQPLSVKSTINSYLKENKIQFACLNESKIKGYDNILILGCGSAYHVGVCLKYVFEKLCQIPVQVDYASEFRYRESILSKNTLVIVISQSGETADSLAGIKLAKLKNVDTLGIINVVGSSIAREVDYVLYTYAGPEISVATTKAYSAQLVLGYMLAIKFVTVRKKINEEQYQTLIKQIKELPYQIEQILKDEKNIQHLSSQFINTKDIFLIGRNIDYAIVLEGSLKMKEVSYIHTEAYPAGELKHGTISLIEKDTLVIGSLTQENVIDKTFSNMLETKSRGAKLLAITSNEIDCNICDYTIKIPKTNDLFATSLAIIPLQIMSYYLSVLKGNDVDKPRNLAKSVTVE